METIFTDDYPPSIDEFRNDRDVVLQYEYEDGMKLAIYVELLDKDGSMEQINHLLTPEEYDYCYSICLKHETALIQDHKRSLAMSAYDDMKLSQQLKGLI
jgi:hypothetical protein